MGRAAQSLARGDLDGALRLYELVFAADPRNWAVANTLGDLYTRIGRAEEAVTHFMLVAEQLAADGFAAKARAFYRKILRLEPGNENARRRVDELDRQQVGEGSPFLKRVLQTARTLRGRVADDPAPAVEPPPAPAPSAPIEQPPPEMPIVTATPQPSPAQAPASAVSGAAASVADEIEALEHEIVVCAEAGRDRGLTAVQYKLAAACLRGGHYRQAFDLAVDICTREPRDVRHREHLERIIDAARSHGRTFVAPPVPDPDEEIELDLDALMQEPPPPAAPPPAPSAPPVQERIAAPVTAPAVSAGGSIAIGPPFGNLLKEWSDPERPLEEIRNALIEDAAAAAEEGYAQALRLIDARQFTDAIAPLEEAMCLPHLRATAGSCLARVYRDSGRPADALAVLEAVVEMPPEDEDRAHELAYELARTLEALGQDSQALGVYRELMAEVGPAYLDIATRVQRLAAA